MDRQRRAKLLLLAHREFRHQNVIRVRDSAALVMHDVILAVYRCPNETFAWERWIADGIGRVPVLTWFCEFAVPTAVTKREDCGWQIAGRVNFMEACSIQQSLP